METLISQILFKNWQQKLFALVSGIVIWFFVNHTIIATKMIPSVPVRVVNIPNDKTVLGLLSNGILNKRLTLTLTGTKDVVDKLEPGDLEVLVDASTIDHNDWILRLTKANLNSLDSAVDLNHHITGITHSEYVIKLRDLITTRIPITLLPPKGEAPQGYEFLNVWPQELEQTVSGAEEEIEKLKLSGLELTFNLNKISKQQLDQIAERQQNSDSDEISFFVPDGWKKVRLPCRNNALEEINDPEAEELQLDFLRKKVIPINTAIPVRIFYPLQYSDTINPKTHPLLMSKQVQLVKNIPVYVPTLYVQDVTEAFIHTIRDNLEIVITASPAGTNEYLSWNVEVIDPYKLEDAFVDFIFKHHPHTKDANPKTVKRREALYRNRFREYLDKLELFISPDTPLILHATLTANGIQVTSPTY